jgi:hypothetical protein
MQSMRIISQKYLSIFFIGLGIVLSCKEEKVQPPAGNLQLSSIRIGTYSLDLAISSKNTAAPADKPLVGTFTSPLNTGTVEKSIKLMVKSTGAMVPVIFSYLDENRTFSARPQAVLNSHETYTLEISNELKGSAGELFQGLTIDFTTEPGSLQLTSFAIAGIPALNSNQLTNIPVQSAAVEIVFSESIDAATVTNQTITVQGTSGPIPANVVLTEGNKKVTLTITEKMKDLSRYQVIISDQVKGKNGETFQQYARYFYTAPDPAPDFAPISDDALLTLVQQQTFKYFYDFAHPSSGMTRERNTSGNTVTTGGSGFGIMALIVGMERNFISRAAGMQHMAKVVTFLEKADRFHGAWPHWINGSTGKVIPFSTKDDGGDLVETSFLVQGLLTFRQYTHASDTAGNNLINRINKLWQTVEWDWYRKNNENVLYWHWSPTYNWEMNFPLYGYFEEQITYFLAGSSPTHSIPKIVYANGFGKNGAIIKNNFYYGIKLPLESPAPLFWTQYSYLGLDPHFSDDYANYWEQNVNASLINHAYCVANPKNYVGYSDACWGLTASDNQHGYNAHSPANDLGVIAPTAALSAFPYTPAESMKALKYFYYTLGDRLWGPYGFYDAFNLTDGWTANSYLAIDQGPVIIMIENYRTGLLWNLFMSAPEVQNGLNKFSFY